MSQIITVYVSSTTEDLRDYRTAARAAIRDLGLVPILLERFPAQDAAAVRARHRMVNRAAIYVGIYAWRYGWVPSESVGGQAGLSIPALEHTWAEEQGIPRLYFLLDPTHPWPDIPPYVDADPAAQAQLAAFKKQLQDEPGAFTFTTPDDLETALKVALSDVVKDLTGTLPAVGGWRRPAARLALANFVGRQDDATRLGALLTSGEGVAVLRGGGGIGKTALALHLADHLDFPGGVLWVSLGPDAVRPEAVVPPILAAWVEAHAEGRTLAPGDLTPERVRALLSDAPGRMLAVVDDVWHVEPARELHKALPDGTALLITTLDARVEAPGHNYTLQPLSSADALDLLTDRLREAGIDAEPLSGVLRALSRLLEGHALALDLMARLLIEQGAERASELLEGLAANLDGNTPLHALTLEQAIERADPLEAALYLSYGGLGYGFDAIREDLQAKFRALSVIAPGASFERRTAFAVWGLGTADATLSESSAEYAEGALAELVRAGLLEHLPDRDRYALHIVPHLYARALSAQAGEHDAALGHYIRHVIGDLAAGLAEHPTQGTNLDHLHYVGTLLLDRIQRDVLGDTTLEALAEPESSLALPDTDDLPDAAQWLVWGRDFAVITAGYVLHRLFNAEGRRWLSLGLACARLTGDRERTALFVDGLAAWHTQHGNADRSMSYLETSCRIYRDNDNREAEVAALDRLSELYNAHGRTADALDLYKRAVRLKRDLGDQAGEAVTMAQMGRVYSSAGQTQRALNLFQQALPRLREAGNQGAEARALHDIGEIHNATGEHRRALELFQQALPLHRAAGDRAGEARTLNNIGEVFFTAGQTQRALEVYEQALAMLREEHDQTGIARALNNIGEVYSHTHENQKALEYFQAALPLHRESADRIGEARTLYNLAHLYTNKKQYEPALKLYRESLRIAREIGDRRGEAHTLNGIGGCYHATDQPQRALEVYQQALPLYRAMSDRAGEATMLNNVGLIFRATGEYERALTFYRQALPLYRALGDQAGEAAALNNMGLVYRALGQPQRTLDLYQEALALRRTLGDRAGEALLLFNIGMVLHKAFGRTTEAIGYLEQCVTIEEAIGHRDLKHDRATLDKLRRLLAGGTPPSDPVSPAETGPDEDTAPPDHEEDA